jgi:rare lipoprotein A
VRIVSKPPGRACIASLALCLFAVTLVPTTLARSSHRRAKWRVAHSRKAKRVAKPVKPGTVIQGKASWYGPGFHGRRTASGERFSRHRPTLAHRGLPFGTRLEITNLKNGRKAVGRVNDRGPHVRGRVVDLSEALARRLGIRGVGSVRCVVLPRPGVGKRVAAVERKPRATPKPVVAANEMPCSVDTGLMFGPFAPAAESAPASLDAAAMPEMAAAESAASTTTP